MTGGSIMRRTSPRFIPVPMAGALLLMLAPAVAGHADESAGPIPAATITVRNCNDSGPGSLRAAVTGALSGDTIDMTALACRRINLTSGAIVTYQEDLTLVGGGGMTVDANRTSSIFRHYGNGRLRIRGMTIARGWDRGDGGCIYSSGKVELRNSLVRWCLAWSPRYQSDGGAIYANDVVTLIDSQVLGNTATRGGGIFTDRLITFRSRICGNHAGSGGGAYLLGGAHTMGGVNINSTTFSGNTGGALHLNDRGDRNSVIANSTISGNYGRRVGRTRYGPILYIDVDDGSAAIINSTISGNTPGYGATVSISGRTRSIVNSTIAFNQHTGYEGSPCPPGAAAVGFSGWPEATSPHIESTIVANNFCDGTPFHDIGIPDLPGPEPEVVGANNLITSSTVPLPPDTISVDPRLAPLADNGGRTRTHALRGDSPAIDMGNNAAGLDYDQRGAGFPRVVGPQADIGAYER